MAIYYIATNGNDNNPGTFTQPWLTLTKANATLVAGDTLYFRAGSYTHAENVNASCIYPANSGTAGNYITYSGYQSEVVNLTDCNYGAELTNRSYIKIYHIRFTEVDQCWVWMHDAGIATHNIIDSCYFSDLLTDSWSGIWLGLDSGGTPTGTANYIQIINNEFHDTCWPNGETIQMEGYASYNLIENNYFYYAPHACIGTYQGWGQISYNIIRNNYIENKWHLGINLYSHSSRNLIENNTIVDCGDDHLNNTCGSEGDRLLDRSGHSGIEIGGPYNIIRRNIVVNCGNVAFDSYSRTSEWGTNSDHNRTYHNTFHENWDSAYANTGELMNDNIFKNNIYTNAVSNEVHWDAEHASPDPNYFVWNDFYGSSTQMFYPTTGSVTTLQSTHPTYWNNNIQSDPSYVSEPSRNFHLNIGSPCINAGTWLTTITSPSGSGTSFVVADAGYFCDGFGIITGDIIQLQGQTVTATINDIDYATNTITFSPGLTWTSGLGVAQLYSGSAPDMGAYEYTGGTTHDFSIVCLDSGTVEAGGNIEFAIIADSQSGLVGPVAFSASGGPPGTVITWPRGAIWNLGGQNTYPNLILSIFIPIGTPIGDYLINVTGVSQND